MKILVTGGAGYIGSHMVKTLGEKGHDIVVYDNLSTGYRDSVLYGELVVADLSDNERLNEVFIAGRFDAVIHFAAYISVEESVRNPLKYYRNNFSNALNLINACVSHGVNKFIFSSTAAVYGMPLEVPVPEDSPLLPINPYGHSKRMVEQVLKDVDDVSDFRYVALRYFNAAGADPDGKIGERHNPESHLIPLTIQAALGLRDGIKIFGSDYSTSDGTCVRDYIHVNDLVDAHLLSLEYLTANRSSRVFNCGYGKGFSVRQVIDEVRRVTGSSFKVIEADRREGDPSVLFADSSLIKRELGWKPSCDDLGFIIKTAWEWEKSQRDLNLLSLQTKQSHP